LSRNGCIFVGANAEGAAEYEEVEYEEAEYEEADVAAPGCCEYLRCLKHQTPPFSPPAGSKRSSNT